MLDFNAGKGLDMDIRSDLFNNSQSIKIIGIGKIRMNTTDHVDLGNWFIKTFTNLFLDIINTHLIGLFMTLFLTECTELAQVGADV